MKSFLTLLIAMMLALCVSARNAVSAMQRELSCFVADKEASIGIAVIVDGDTVAVNGDRYFAMLSVYKLPIVIALGESVRAGAVPRQVTLTDKDLHPDTHSPMRDRYVGCDTVQVDVDELIDYAMRQSDNNASDVLMRLAGGADSVSAVLRNLGTDDIMVVSTEDEMHADPSLCYKNTATPVAMAALIDRLYRDCDDDYSRMVKRVMETCGTGEHRLARPLRPRNAILGHKTGTGFTLPDGRLMAVNDAGYVCLPDGRSYVIAVFIENSAYDMERTEALIAEISRIVLSHLM